MLLQVAEIDEDCDACIDFEGLDAKQWVLKSKFGNISVLSQEDVLKERAQREELVAMLIAPTQAAGALNKANNEGATPLMHASVRGLCGVVELLLAAGADGPRKIRRATQPWSWHKTPRRSMFSVRTQTLLSGA